MPNPIGIQCSRQRGYRLPPNTLRVTRPSRWGNPFRKQAFHLEYSFAEIPPLVEGRLNSETILLMPPTYLPAVLVELHFAWLNHWSAKWPDDFERWIAPLRGKNLACFCKIGEPCHRDNLLYYAAEWRKPA